MKLYYNTVNKDLKDALIRLMSLDKLSDFRLVGGTALSLQIGHRMSIDIDLFTDAEYGTIDFEAIDNDLRTSFKYVDQSSTDLIGFGRSYFVGNSPGESIKLDLYYTDKFIFEYLSVDGIRLATIEEIIAMKVDVINRAGRKKDFWDMHALLIKYSFEKMLEFHYQRYPYNHDEKHIKSQFSNFEAANEDFDPICLKGNFWEIVKLDLIDFVG